MPIYITLHNGLGNRLLPMMSILRFARDVNEKMYIHWTGTPCRSLMNIEGNDLVEFYDIFKKVDDIEVISEEDIRKIDQEKGSVKYYFHYDNKEPHVLYPIDKHKNTFVFMAILPVLRESEKELSNKYKFHNPMYGYFEQDEWYNEVSQYFRSVLKPVTPLDRIINVYFKKFKQNMIGIHLRKTDGGFTEMNWNEIDKHIIDRIKEWFSNNTSLGVFLATDCKDTTKKFKNEFGNKLLTFDPHEDKHKNNAFNTRCAVIDMFLLSKCNKLIVGTFGSTFGLCSAMLSEGTPFFVLSNDQYSLPENI